MRQVLGVCVKRTNRGRIASVGVAVLHAVLLAHVSTGAEYPSRAVRYVIPSAPGGNADVVGRLLGQRLSESLGQPVVVENRSGASNIIGTEFVVKSAPDGHTLLQVASAHFTNPSMVKQLPYDTVRDLAPISLISSTPLMLVTHPSLPVRSVKELIAFARAKPGQLNYSSAGVGTSGHLAGALFSYMAKVDITHVAYRGVAQAITDVLGGDLHLAFPGMTSSLQYVKQKRLKALAMTGPKRSVLAPELPTVAEAGVPGYHASIWNGLFAPANTPSAVITKLNFEVGRILNAPETRERFGSLGADVSPSSPEEFAAFTRNEIQKWATVVKAAGIKAE